MPLPESAVEFLEQQRRRVRQLQPKRRIVFPEGGDARVVEAAGQLAAEGASDSDRSERGGGTGRGIVDPRNQS
jgi:hypothetical protein